MSIFHGFNINASALTAQRLRMDIASSNIANQQTTRATVGPNGEFEPYRRKMAVLQPSDSSFKSFLSKAKHSQSQNKVLSGVRVSNIIDDREPFKAVFNPTHPDANEEGYVYYPNVDPLKEMVDLMGASRSYEANITSLNATKDMLLKTLEIGR